MATKQKSGLYRAKIKIGVDENGKDFYKYISAKTKKELEIKRQQAIAYYIDGDRAADDVLFAPYAIQWYRTNKEPTLKPGTRANYRVVFNRYILPTFGDRNLRAIRPSDLQQFFTTLKDFSSTYSVIAKSIFNGVFLSACADRILDRNPVSLVKVVRPQKENNESKIDKHRALTLDERKVITDMCAKDSDALFVALLYYLGLRQGEAAGLRWGDIDWARGLVHVQRSIDQHDHNKAATPKTAASDRMVPLPAPLAAILSGLRGMPDLYILHTRNGTPLFNSARLKLWRRLINERCGIPDITPHSLRHNYITLCWEAGNDVYATARFVGHSNVSTTLEIYTHLSKEREERNAQAVREIFAK